MKKLLLAATILGTLLLAGCDDEATVVSRNTTKAADNFEIERRIVFYNGITDAYILTIEGRCSIDTKASGKSFQVVCKVGPSAYKKHFLGLSDNVTYFAEQLEPAKLSGYHYRVTFKPQQIVPDIDFRGDGKALKDALTPDTKD